jgi:hypothetical protein
MTARFSVPVGCGYRVTQDGHDALSSSEMCECTLELKGGLFVCLGCDTVYGKASFSASGRPEVSVPRWAR